jgi:CDP-4-dehydro-6-deoxyglucose reductase
MIDVIVNKGQEVRAVQVDGESSLLDSLLGLGLDVNYSCRRGDCGQCTAAIAVGDFRAIDSGKPTVARGVAHLCNVIPCSPRIELRLPYWPQLEGIKAQRSPAKIHEISRLSDDVLKLTLRLPPSARFRFLPGQHLRVTNRHRVTRSYSLAEPPRADGLLVLHVRIVAGGIFSDYLHAEARAGDLWQVEGPLGHFFLRDEPAERSVFLATGTGIAPIHAIFMSLTEPERARLGHVSIYWGNRHHADAYLDEAMQILARRWGCEYRTLASREPSPGHALHVQDQLALDLAEGASLLSSYVYACGNPAMIEAASEACFSLGLGPGRFVSDPFTAS